MLRRAATVMVLRDARDGIEVFMLRRSARSSFAPDAFVFPGGTVDPQDLSADGARRVLGLTLDTLESEFRAVVRDELPCDVPPPGSEHAAGLMRAALREVFEESGIVLARQAGGDAISAAAAFDPDVQAARDRVRNGELSFDDVLALRDWYADAGELALFSHWITPESEPRRYDTYFFAVRAPGEQAGSADAVETHDDVWISPAQALERFSRGEMHLVYPTIKHLERLVPFTRTEDVLQFARTKPIVTIMPTTTPDDGFAMPASLEGAW